MGEVSSLLRGALSLLVGCGLVACGGSGNASDRKSGTQTSSPAPPVVDPGSLAVYSCEEDQPSKGITTTPIDDWETGAGSGWYTNNDKCEPCQDATNEINGSIDAGSEVLPAQLDAGLKAREACIPPCLASQIPSYFAKPVPADIIGRTQGQSIAGRCGSKYAFHVISGPFTKWGGQLGINFLPPKCVTGDCPTDRTAIAVEGGPYDGIAFWARAVPGSGTGLRVQVGESHTDTKFPEPGDAGPPCVDNVGIQSPNDTSQGCDSFGSFVTLDSDWHFYALPFEEMRQAGWGKRAPYFDIQHISNLTFFYAQGLWNVWIDDISFYKRSAR